MRRLLTPLFAMVAVMLVSCGYQLVGHGESAGAIPADVKTLSLIVRGSSDRRLDPMLRQRLKSDRYALIDEQDVIDQAAHAKLRVNISQLLFRPSAYDAAGVETEYRMVFAGSLLIERQGKAIWQSGLISADGDVYVAGGPASIEASRERLYNDLRKQWLQDALGRLRSGF